MRRCVGLRRALRFAFDWKLLVVDRKACSDPKGVDDVVPAWICRVGMNEDAQPPWLSMSHGTNVAKTSLAKATWNIAAS
jgi:hypothetical protein